MELSRSKTFTGFIAFSLVMGLNILKSDFDITSEVFYSKDSNFRFVARLDDLSMRSVHIPVKEEVLIIKDVEKQKAVTDKIEIKNIEIGASEAIVEKKPNVKKVKSQYKEGQYSLYKVIWKNTYQINTPDVELDGSLSITNRPEGVEVSVSSLLNLANGENLIDFDIYDETLKGDSLFSYEINGSVYPVSIRRAGTDVVISPINGKLKGARFFFSMEDKTDLPVQALPNNPTVRNMASAEKDQDNTSIEEEQSSDEEDIIEDSVDSEGDKYIDFNQEVIERS